MSKKKKYTEQVGVMFTPEQMTRIDKITDEAEVSKSEFIRELVERKLNQEGN